MADTKQPRKDKPKPTAAVTAKEAREGVALALNGRERPRPGAIKAQRGGTVNEKRILWRGTAPILYDAKRQVDDSVLALVNRYAGGAASAENVYVARMVVCNDQVDLYSTQFTQNALRQIVPLLLGANILRNHNEYGSEDLPIGRIFNAGTEVVGQVVQVWAEMYWDRGTEDGDAMAQKIALRLWRECSLSWWMMSFTSSATGKPFGEAPYTYPGQVLPDGTTVVGIMDDVVEVNEVSIVARGGQIGTSLSNVRERADHEHDVRELIHGLRSRAGVMDRLARRGQDVRENFKHGSVLERLRKQAS